jgi:hypothetical protein
MRAKLYSEPESVRRPHGSYRFDVFSLKADRRMTLFGKATLSQFIELETDYNVTSICERPLKIPDLKPEKCVDFWALKQGRPNFYLLVTRSAARDADKPKPAMEDFRKWVKQQNGILHIVVEDVFHSRRTRLANLSLALQHLVDHKRVVTQDLIGSCYSEMPSRFSLRQIENAFPTMDPMLVRAVVFACLMRGSIACQSIDQEVFNYGTVFSKP